MTVTGNTYTEWAYNIDGVDALTLDFKVGNTYVFDLSDTTNGLHRFQFATTPFDDQIAGAPDEYLEGVTKSDDGQTVSITITDATPMLYYVCKFHAGMGSGSTVSAPTNTLLTWENNTILIEDNTHFDINQDVEFNAINMA